MNPLVSVIMPTFNRATFLIRSIKSVQTQTYTTWELIIVDDGSTDTTESIIQTLISADNRIKYCRIKNSGPSAARNVGLRLAKGEYVTFLDSDDEYLPNRLERLSTQLQTNASDFCSSWLECKSEKSSAVYTFPENGFERNMKLFLHGDMQAFSGMNVFLKRTLLEKVGYFDEALQNWEDSDFYIRLFQCGIFLFVREVLMIYHQHPDSLNRTPRIGDFAYFYIKYQALFTSYGLLYYLQKNYGNILLLAGKNARARIWFFRSLFHTMPGIDYFKILTAIALSFLPRRLRSAMIRRYEHTLHHT